MIYITIGKDITHTVSNVFITTNLPSRHQCLVGAVINGLLFLGISFWLGKADVAVGATADRSLRTSYQTGFWLGAALPAVWTVIWLFTKIGHANGDLTLEGREGLEERQRLEAEGRSAGAAEGLAPAPGGSGD